MEVLQKEMYCLHLRFVPPIEWGAAKQHVLPALALCTAN
jgi:hypothetical protein